MGVNVQSVKTGYSVWLFAAGVAVAVLGFLAGRGFRGPVYEAVIHPGPGAELSAGRNAEPADNDFLVRRLRADLESKERMIEDLKMKVASLHAATELPGSVQPTDAPSSLLDPELSRLLRLSWRDYSACLDPAVRHPDLVRRLSQGYEKLMPSESLLHRAEFPWLLRMAAPAEAVDSYEEWLEGVVGCALDTSESSAVKGVVKEYYQRVNELLVSLEKERDWRVRELAMAREFAVKNELLIACLRPPSAKRLQYFWALRDRRDHPWIAKFVEEYTERPDVTESVHEILEWLASYME